MYSWPDLQYQKCVSFCEVGHKSKQNVHGCPPDICATSAHKGISCMLVSMAVHRAHYWLRLLICLTSESCITPSRSLRASQELRSFLISANLTSTCPVIIACIIFSDRVFTIKFYWAKKSNDNSLNYFGVSEMALTNNSRGNVLHSLFGNVWLLGWAQSTCKVYPMKLFYMNICIYVCKELTK